MAGAVRVRGLKELNRDLGKVSRKAQRELQRELRKLAEPVAADARSRAQRFGAKTASGIAAGSSRGSAVVRQRNRKTTGLRPDFGGVQMREAFLPALEAHENEIERGVEGFLDRITSEAGLGQGGLL